MGVRCHNWWAQKTGKWFQVVSQEKQFASGMFQPSRAEQHPTPCAGIQYSSFIQCHRGGQTWAQHKLNPINSYAEESVNKASPTKKEPNCLRIATVIWHLRSVLLSWDTGLCKGLARGLRAEPRANLPGPLSSGCNKLWSKFPGMRQNQVRATCRDARGQVLTHCVQRAAQDWEKGCTPPTLPSG